MSSCAHSLCGIHTSKTTRAHKPQCTVTTAFFPAESLPNVDPIMCIVAETSHAQHTLSIEPAILLTRYIDNTYVGFCNVP